MGRVRTLPAASSKRTSTRRAERIEPVLRAKKRKVGWRMPTHIAGVVAELPGGSRSDRVSPGPCTMKGSFPVTTDARVSVHPAARCSRVPSGTRA
jgi:hypothetical protein